MFRLVCSMAVVCLSGFSVVVSAQQTDGDAPEAAMTDEVRLGYSAGVQFGNFLEHAKDSVDFDAVVRGLSDVLQENDLELSEAEQGRSFAELQRILAAKKKEALGVEGKRFLEENAKKSGVVTLDSGLQYKVLTDGAGPTPSRADTVRTHYAGRLLDGTEFDSSYKRGEPMSFPVTRVISGWTEALLLMQVGSKWELYIPANLAYGDRGAPPKIPPFATLIFEIELLGIE